MMQHLANPLHNPLIDKKNKNKQRQAGITRVNIKVTSSRGESGKWAKLARRNTVL